jgi:hypothetical protein
MPILACCGHKLPHVPETPFRYISVQDWEYVNPETSGRREKYWLRDPATGRDWLFKPVTVKDGVAYGEAWAEKIASHLGALLGIPCAEVELAFRYSTAGSMALNLKPEPRSWELQEGAVLLTRFEDFVPHVGKKGRHPGHTVEHIAEALEGALAPPGWAAPFPATGFDVLAGYLTFDAWIANSDRHEQNWAVLREGSALYLCGSYDHSSSLGWNVSDAQRAECLADPARLERWCGRGKALCFDRSNDRVLSLVDVAVRALGLASDQARAHWLGTLEQLTGPVVADLVSRTPGMSEVARTFAVSVLETNRGRLLDAC